MNEDEKSGEVKFNPLEAKLDPMLLDMFAKLMESKKDDPEVVAMMQ